MQAYAGWYNMLIKALGLHKPVAATNIFFKIDLNIMIYNGNCILRQQIFHTARICKIPV